MAFDHIGYTRFDFSSGILTPIPGGLTWNQVLPAGQWLNPIVNVAATQIRITNTDGSITVIYGSGLAIDPVSLQPTSGVVSSLQRSSADQTTLYEQVSFFNGNAAGDTTLASVFGNGVGTWLTGGDDFYELVTGTEKITELANGGHDQVTVDASSYVLGSNLEDLAMSTPTNNVATGNALDNSIVTGTGNDKLFGADGNDTLNGGSGNDYVGWRQGR